MTQEVGLSLIEQGINPEGILPAPIDIPNFGTITQRTHCVPLPRGEDEIPIVRKGLNLLTQTGETFCFGEGSYLILTAIEPPEIEVVEALEGYYYHVQLIMNPSEPGVEFLASSETPLIEDQTLN